MNSKLIKDADKILKDCYSFEDIVKNDVQGIMTRIQFVERNEEMKYYV